MTDTTHAVAAGLIIAAVWVRTGHGPLVWLARAVRLLRVFNRAVRYWALDSVTSWPCYWQKAGKEIAKDGY